MKAAGKNKQALIFTIDGSCSGLANLSSGQYAADSVQYPGKMASLGVSAIKTLATGGSKPTPSEGKDFFNTGTALATASPLDGVPSQTIDEAKSACWGS